MPFCPNCKYEYVDGIQECPDCEAPLVARLPEHDAEWKEITWTPLRDVPGSVYAEMVREVLEREGIPCFIKSFFGSGALGVVTGADFAGASARIFVPEEDLARSQSVQEQMLDGI